MQPGQMQRLVGVDVAKSGDKGLIEQQRLKATMTGVEGQVKAVGRKTALQRFRAESAGHLQHIFRQPDAAELARIVEDEANN